MEVYSDKARWERALDLYWTANEIEERSRAGNPLVVQELTDRLVEPYVNRSPDLHWSSPDRDRIWYPDRHYLYSHEIETALRSSEVSSTLPAILKELAGRLIGPEYEIVEIPSEEETEG